MSKVLDSLPTGVPLKAPPGAAQTNPGSRGSQTSERVPGAVERPERASTANRNSKIPMGLDRFSRQPGGWLNSPEGSAWLIKRCDQFGVASSKYFKKNPTCPKPTKGA